VSMTPEAKLPPVSTAPAANLPPVSTTSAANFATSYTCVVDTGGKFAIGVNNTSGKLPPVSTTPAANLPPVSLTTVANNGNNIRLSSFRKNCFYKFGHKYELWNICNPLLNGPGFKYRYKSEHNRVAGSVLGMPVISDSGTFF
jgi:hypothetical protein